MKAAVFQEPGRVALMDVPVPEPGPDEVLIELEGCGVCGSDLQVWRGAPWFEYPLPPGAPGHEGWGRVAAVGDLVTGMEIGDRVAGITGRSYAPFDVAAASDVVSLPPSLDDVAFPGEPLGCAMNVLRRSAIEPGQRVAVIGVGFMGALLIQLAARRGAEVIAVTRRGFALDLALQMGATEKVALADGALERVLALTGGELCDVVIEAAGKQETLDLAADLVKVRGRLVIAGYHQDGPRTVNMQQWNWRGIDVVNAHERDPLTYVAGIQAAVDAVTRGELDPRPLMTDRFELSHTGDAFEASLARPEGFLKALVMM